MKAAIYYGPGDIRVEDIERPKAKEQEVVLKVGACGICPITDIPRYLKALPDSKPGLAPGHEFGGEVVEVGSKVTTLKVGDRVTGLPFRPCYECEACKAGDFGRCHNFVGGVLGTGIHGAFAEYLLCPFASDENIIKLPQGVSFSDGALVEQLGLSVGLANKAKAGDVVVILGQDLVGLGTVALLKENDVGKVIVSDVSDKRLEKAKELGADVVVNTTKDDVVKVVMEETGGMGADVVIEVAGKSANFLKAIDVARFQGAIWLAAFYTDGPFMFDLSLQRPEMPHSNLSQKGGLSVHCSWGTMSKPTSRSYWRPRWEKAIKLIQSGKVTADKLVTHAFPLDKIKDAFKVVIDSPDAIKVIVEP